MLTDLNKLVQGKEGHNAEYSRFTGACTVKIDCWNQ